MRFLRGRRGWVIGALFGYIALVLAFVVARGADASVRKMADGQGLAAVFNQPTYSSPITMSANNQLVWVVNPDDHSVSVIRTDTNAVVQTITVGDEPQSVAVDPNDRYAYVANAAGHNVTVIAILNPNPGSFFAQVAPQAGVNGNIATGAEPWNIVISPDGKRVFVANSSQDTITVINAENLSVIGNVDLRNSLCNGTTAAERQRHFQPRGLAVTADSHRLFVTRFLSFTKSGGVQGDDNGKEGVVCRLDIDTSSTNIAAYQPARVIQLASGDTGFTATVGNPPQNVATFAFPNQLQSIVIRGGSAYLPNIAASPSRPLKFDADTQAFVNRIDNVGSSETDAGAINLHLGARDPEGNPPNEKKKLFFANPWAIAFTNQSGTGAAYVVSAGSDLLVKLNVAADGTLSFTDDADTTRYIDLNDPANSATSGANAGKNPLGIAINDAGTRAYVMNFVSRNVSVVNLTNDSVIQVIKTTNLPQPGSLDERILVGAEMFFSSRGNFVTPPNGTISTQQRLSNNGWQNCASCHFAGLTDGVVWQFNSGPRKAIPMNGTFDPKDGQKQRILNYSAIFDEVQDFEANIRNISGPGPLGAAQACSDPAPGAPSTSTFDPNHGLLLGDTDVNQAPCAVPNLLGRANAGRNQLKVQLPGSQVQVPALDALKEWVQFGIRTPNPALTTQQLTAGGGSSQGGVNSTEALAGRALFFQAGCQSCHGGRQWTKSIKDFQSPLAAAEVAAETDPNAAGVAPDPNTTQYLFRFLKDIKSFNLNVPGQGNPISGQPQIGAVEFDTAGKDALGKDHDGDGKGNGFNISSILGIYALPPYYHNGACETLACVVANVDHRSAGLPSGQQDPLYTPEAQALLVKFLESIGDATPPDNLFLPVIGR